MKTKNNSAIEKHLKLHFSVASITFFIATLGITAFFIFSMFPENTNISAYYLYLLSSLLIPILIVVASYFLTPQYNTKLEKFFWTLVLSFVGNLIFLTVLVLTPTFSFTLYSNDENNWMFQEAARASVGLIPVVAYFAYFYMLNKKSKNLRKKTKK